MSTAASISEVPLLDLKAQYRNIHEEVKEAIHEVLESQHFIMGPKVASFEENMADYCHTAHAIGCASGSDALLLSLMALDVGPGDAVITSSYTFFATGGAIARLGAIPVFLDIDPLSYNLDPHQVGSFLAGNHPLNEKLALGAEDVKAMIPVHLFGQMADMDALMDLAREYEVSVVEDAAQAIGAEYKGRRAGSIGEVGCFSFFPSKNLGGYGDGGLITTDDDEMAEKLSVLRLHGAKPKYHHRMVGINSRLDALQAAVLGVKLRYLDEWSQARRQNALTYNRMFKEAGLDGLINPENKAETAAMNTSIHQKNEFREKLYLPHELSGDPERDGRHIYHQYIICTRARRAIITALGANNIGSSIYYPLPLHEQECFAHLGYEAADCPVAQEASKTTLALPIYPEITTAQQQYVADTIREALREG